MYKYGIYSTMYNVHIENINYCGRINMNKHE